MPDLGIDLAGRALEAALRGVPLLGVAWVAGRLARGAPAAVRHAIWCAALVAQATLLVAPGVVPEVGVPGWPDWATTGERNEAVAPVAAPSARRTPVSAQTATADFPASTGRDPSALRLAWWAGAAFALVGLIVGRARRSAHRRRASPAPAVVVARAGDAARSLGVRRPVRVLVSPECGTPVTWGVIRPVVLLPTRAAEWPADRLRVVFLHELAHVRRLDALSRGLAEALSILLWFDPLVWLARGRMREAGEAACDDAVLRTGLRPSRYVRHLVEVAREAIAPPPAASHAVIVREGLEPRVRSILDAGVPRWTASPGAAGLAGALAVVLALPLGAIGYAPSDGAFSLACRYDGGRHLDVTRGDAWIVEWEGDGCRVAVRAEGEVAFAGDLSGVADVAPGASLSIDVVGPAGSRRLLVRSAGNEWWVNGRAAAFDGEARTWLSDFLLELDRHTAFAVDRRFPALLLSGGPDRVIAEAARSQGGHAGGIYLGRLVETEPLDADQVERILDVAAATVDVDAVMADLLDGVRKRHDVTEPPLAAAYARAAGTLQARAAREQALAGL